MVQTIDWAPREQVLHSFELLARYVMPQFQGSILSTAASNQWAFEHQETLMAGRTRAIDRAKSDYATKV
jgi:limonene 1,2-monooxygenase